MKFSELVEAETIELDGDSFPDDVDGEREESPVEGLPGATIIAMGMPFSVDPMLSDSRVIAEIESIRGSLPCEFEGRGEGYEDTNEPNARYLLALAKAEGITMKNPSGMLYTGEDYPVGSLGPMNWPENWDNDEALIALIAARRVFK